MEISIPWPWLRPLGPSCRSVRLCWMRHTAKRQAGSTRSIWILNSLGLFPQLEHATEGAGASLSKHFAAPQPLKRVAEKETDVVDNRQARRCARMLPVPAQRQRGDVLCARALDRRGWSFDFRPDTCLYGDPHHRPSDSAGRPFRRNRTLGVSGDRSAPANRPLTKERWNDRIPRRSLAVRRRWRARASGRKCARAASIDSAGALRWSHWP
jgi:hypothetical protein